MNDLRKHLYTGLFATAALLVAAVPASAQVTLGAASGFTLLGTTVTCVGPGSVIGDVGATTFTPGACTFEGAVPPATDSAAVLAQAALTTAYNNIRNGDCTPLTDANTGTTSGKDLSTLSGVTLAPGTYCIDDVAKTGTLTLAGPSTGIWIFKTVGTADGALTGTNFSVVMTGGGQPCNVFWAPIHAVTMTTSVFKGTILAGNPTDGSITTTGGSLIGRALAKIAVSLTGPSAIGCGALPAIGGSPDCKPEKDHGYDKHHKKYHKKCNQGVGNGREDCDPGKSDHGRYPFWSNDEHGGKPGDPGRKGGYK